MTDYTPDIWVAPKSGYTKTARSMVDKHPRWGEVRIAREVIKGMSPSEVDDVAVRYISSVVWAVKRAEARQIEEAATKRSAEEQAVELAEMYAPGGSRHESNAHNRKGRSDCHSCGCDKCETALSENEAFEEGLSSRYWGRLTDSLKVFTSEMADQIRLEITEELLSSIFALGDGRRVTWGEATVEDHQKCIEMLQGNAAANIDTAAKHEAAIRMLSEAGAETLGGL